MKCNYNAHAVLLGVDAIFCAQVQVLSWLSLPGAMAPSAAASADARSAASAGAGSAASAD